MVMANISLYQANRRLILMMWWKRVSHRSLHLNDKIARKMIKMTRTLGLLHQRYLLMMRTFPLSSSQLNKELLMTSQQVLLFLLEIIKTWGRNRIWRWVWTRNYSWPVILVYLSLMRNISKSGKSSATTWKKCEWRRCNKRLESILCPER